MRKALALSAPVFIVDAICTSTSTAVAGRRTIVSLSRSIVVLFAIKNERPKIKSHVNDSTTIAITGNAIVFAGVDDGNVFMLQESLLGADPSGKEGRPGSAP